MPNTNTIIKPVEPASSGTTSVILNAQTINTTNTAAPLPFLTLPPNTIITGINSIPPVTNVGTSLMNLPTNAVITGIKPAPPDAPYSSTIFITSTSPSSTTSTTAAETTSTATINNATIITAATDQHQMVVTTNMAKQINTNNNNKSFEPSSAAIKRRRISLFCSNKYDKISENLAVDAVLKNILPDNSEYIQINNPLLTTVADSNTSTTTATTTTTAATTMTKSTSKFVTTVGSTKISKLTTTESKNISNTNRLETETGNKKLKEPIVFDVNFMDDGDEPTASIVIKPTNSSTSTSTYQTTSTASSASIGTTISSIVQTTTTPTHISNTSTKAINTASTVTTTNTSADAYKSIKLPTLFNTPAAIVGTNANNSGKARVVTSLLNTKQQTNVVSKFSSTKITNLKLPTTVSTTSTSSSIENAIKTPFVLGKTSLPIKVQKILTTKSSGVTVQCAKSITTISSPSTTTASGSKQQTLTVQDVQAMLNKPGLNVASTISSSAASAATSASVQLQISPSIKATIAPAKVSTISTPAEIPSTSTAPSTSSATFKANTVPNSTLTISKVQSFGSPSPKNQNNNTNNEKKVQFSPQQQQQQVPVTSATSGSERCLPTPPSHIQYGYIVSSSYANQKFVAKRVAEEFYVKVPSVGILKLQGLGAVNTYLNKYINKTLKEVHPTHAVWQFVAASKAVQMQNHQKSLLVRKTKTPIGSLGGVGKSKNTKNGNKAAATTTDSSLNEPILIDD